MLSLLRKYQKVVFGSVAASIVVSVMFFGTYDAVIDRVEKPKDISIGACVDGSKMSKMHIQSMVRFLSSDQKDAEAYHSLPNFFNEGVIAKDFIETGFASMLASQYFEELQDEWNARLEKEKKFRPYSHPSAPFISAENLWAQFLPSLQESMQAIRSSTFTWTKDNCHLLFDLYKENTKFPSTFLRRFLSYQQNQYEWIPKDPYLQEGDLALFHFHNPEDWFGRRFIELAAQVIHNCAIYAKQKGYEVGYEEAKADLLKQGYESMRSYFEGQVNAEQLDRCWRQTLMTCQMDEREAVKIWQEVLLFRKLFEDWGNTTLVDQLSLDSMNQYAQESREIEKYVLPKQLQLKDFASMLKLQVYLEQVAKDKIEGLALPRSFKTKEEIEKSNPRLIERTYNIEYAHVTEDATACEIPLKELWTWQSQEENGALIRKQFPQLFSFSEKDVASVLEKIGDQERILVDNYSRSQILKQSPQLIKAALDQAQPRKKELSFISLSKKSALAGIEDPDQLEKLLQQEDSADKLDLYTQDGKNFYRIRLLEKPQDSKLLSLEEALSKGVLDELLDEKLKAHHAAAQAASPASFKNEQGQFKEFGLVKNEIGAYCYRSLLELIEKEARKESCDLKQKQSLDAYASWRLYPFAKEAKEDIEQKGESSSYLAKQGPFFLEVVKEVVSRKDGQVSKELFMLPEHTFSSLELSPTVGLSFYQVTQTLPLQKPDPSVLMKQQKVLSEEAQRVLMQELLTWMNQTKSLHQLPQEEPNA